MDRTLLLRFLCQLNEHKADDKFLQIIEAKLKEGIFDGPRLNQIYFSNKPRGGFPGKAGKKKGNFRNVGKTRKGGKSGINVKKAARSGETTILSALQDNSLEVDEMLFEVISNKLNSTYEDILNILSPSLDGYFSLETPPDWKCLCLSFYILQLLSEQLENDILSVQQSKDAKNCLKNIVNVGIRARIQPNLPFHTKLTNITESEDIFLNYNILKSTTLILCHFMKNPNLRLLILPDSLKTILVAVYQIAYCPLKKPAINNSCITPEIYQKLQEEKQLFLDLLNNLQHSIHPNLYVRETMIIFQSNSPAWFKKAVSQTLTNIIRSKNGVENISIALLDGINNDTARTWKILDVITKLVVSCKGFSDFQDNICKQVIGLLDKVNEEESLVFERIFVCCVKTLYQSDKGFTKDMFLRRTLSFLLSFTYHNQKFKDGEDITKNLMQTVRLCHSIFIEDSVELPKLPLEILAPVILVLLRFYVITKSIKSTNEELGTIIISYFETFPEKIHLIFDCFLFSINSEEFIPFRNDVNINNEREKITLNYSEHSVQYSITEDSDCLVQLLNQKTNLLVQLFAYLLNCLINKSKYFKKANENLLNIENELMNEFIERNLVVYKLLSDLADNKQVRKEIVKNPYDIIKYIDIVLKNTIKFSTHKSDDADSSAFQSLFTVLMLLQNLVRNSSKTELTQYEMLVESLGRICDETNNKETKDIISDILISLKSGSGKLDIDEVSELDKVLEDVCDPLLPTRGHGLMTLSKLVEKRDKDVMNRKQYVLNIFQQNLKNEDSYIYLSAINGLAALADVFPDTVLNVLCEEYSDTTKNHNDDGHEVRMKLGETLVRVTKILGDMAPKYKPLLLNTFLIGSKDEDDLIRASSLSNLGEICRVLGYKLGTIVTEILVCVHAIIATDKSPQARRAAVTVIRQLFVGLEMEMIAFLKEDILSIYRTLKDIYRNDKDDVVRLQAQLALEELNENMKSFVFPNPQLNLEKKVIMLN